MYIYIKQKNGISSTFDILGCFDNGEHLTLLLYDRSHHILLKSDISSYEICK